MKITSSFTWVNKSPGLRPDSKAALPWSTFYKHRKIKFLSKLESRLSRKRRLKNNSMLAMRNSPPETSATAPFFEQSWSIKLETLTVTNVSSLGFSLKNLNILMSDASLPFTKERTLEKSSLLGSPFQYIHPKRRLPE